MRADDDTMAFAHTNCARSNRLNTPQTKRASSLCMHNAQTRSAEGRLHAYTASKPTRLEFSSPVEPSKTQNPHPTSSLRQCDTRLLHVPGCALQTRVHVSSARGTIAFVWRGSLWHLGDAPSQSLGAHGWVSQCKNWFGTRNPGRVEGADAMGRP
jgi:hypothetical protein